MDFKKTAARLLEDYDAGKPGTVFERVDLNLSIQDAYNLQFEVAGMRESRGENIAGYKIGCISKTMQQQLGIDQPVFGHVWDTEIYRTGHQLSAKRFDCLAIEGELAVHLLDDVPSPEWLKNNPDVIAGHLLVIELHNYVFRGSESTRATELIANNAIHAGVIKADQDRGFVGFEPQAKFRVEQNTSCLGEGYATHLQKGVVEVVASVAEHLQHREIQLKRGQIVLTGSPLPLWTVSPGDQISVNCEGLNEVSCTILE